MIEKIMIIAALAFTSYGAIAQTNILKSPRIDAFITPSVINKKNLANSKFLQEIAITSNQNLILASDSTFYNIGYGEYVAWKFTDRSISTFCAIGNDIYFADKYTIYRVRENGDVEKCIDLSFVPNKLWSGKDVLYAMCKENKKEEYVVYAFFPKNQKCLKVHTMSSSVIGIAELGQLLYVMSETNLQAISIKKQQYVDMPLKNKTLGKLMSMAIDPVTGAIFISSENGIYQLYKKNIQKICSDKGFLCYDKDGLVMYNLKVPYVIRLRNELLYPQKDVKIYLK